MHTWNPLITGIVIKSLRGHMAFFSHIASRWHFWNYIQVFQLCVPLSFCHTSEF